MQLVQKLAGGRETNLKTILMEKSLASSEWIDFWGKGR